LPFLSDSHDKEDKKIVAKPTKDLLAHSLLMRGNEMINKWWVASDSQYLKLGINFFNEALKIDPDYLDALVGKGCAYSLAGKYDSAMIYYEKVIKIDGEDRYVLGGLGDIYMGSYMTDSAVKYFQKLVEVSPNDQYSNIGLGRVFVLGQFDVIKGLPFLQKAIEIGGNSLSEPLLYIGNAYFIIGEYTKALKYFNKTLLLEPSWCGIDRFYSNILFIQGRYQEALNFLDSIQNFSPCQNSSDVMRFYYYTFQRDFKNAELYYNKSLNSGKSYFDEYEIYLDVYFNYLLKETGRKNEAVKRINNSIKRYEADMMNFNRQWSGMNSRIDKLLLAASYAMLGENEKALDYLSQLEKFGLYEYPITLAFPGFDDLRNNPEFKAIVKRIEDQRAAVREKVGEMEDSGKLNL
jgi:tetratricopeptide (TPR) repeat protein